VQHLQLTTLASFALLLTYLTLALISTVSADNVDEVLDDLIAYELAKQQQLDVKEAPYGRSTDFSKFFVKHPNYSMDAVNKLQSSGVREYIANYFPRSGGVSLEFRLIVPARASAKAKSGKLKKVAALFREKPDKVIKKVKGFKTVFLRRNNSSALVCSLGESRYLLLKSAAGASEKILLDFLETFPLETL